MIDHITAAPGADGLRVAHGAWGPFGRPVRGVVESMNGARFVHDTLEERGWEVLIADAQKVMHTSGASHFGGLTRTVRRERWLARFRLHLVRHRTTLRNRIHASLITVGKPCPVSDCSATPAASRRTGWPPRPVAAQRRRQPGVDRRPRAADRRTDAPAAAARLTATYRCRSPPRGRLASSR